MLSEYKGAVRNRYRVAYLFFLFLRQGPDGLRLGICLEIGEEFI